MQNIRLTYKAIARMAGYHVKDYYHKDGIDYYWFDAEHDTKLTCKQFYATEQDAYFYCCVANNLIEIF